MKIRQTPRRQLRRRVDHNKRLLERPRIAPFAAFERRITYHAAMDDMPNRKIERRSRQRAANRAAIIEAARRVAAREGASGLALRAVAAEAGYAPASVYEYFRNRAELVLALAAEDLGQLARLLREQSKEDNNLSDAAHIALSSLQESGALGAAAGLLEASKVPPDAERLFNGRLIAALTSLADAAGCSRETRGEQADVVLTAALIAGLAILLRSGRLKALGFEEKELLDRLESRFSISLP
jgi:AcrR family transcriptional regulator